MNATVHWTIFDGLDGFPNIIAELNWSEQSGRSYEDVIMAHATQKLSDKSFGMTIRAITLLDKGRIGDMPYRDFEVTYKVKRHLQRSPLLKVSWLESGHPDDAKEQLVTKIIRVFHHSNAGGPATATQKEEKKMKAATILAKIAQRQECSIDTAYRLTEALKAERLLHRKLFIRFKPLLRSFDVVDFDYTQDGDIGNIGFAHDIADIAELFEVLPEINAAYSAEHEQPVTKQFIYTQCNKNRWFTCGDNRQYDRLFDMVGERAALDEIAAYISDHSDNVSADAVYAILEAALGGGDEV